jgi:hypothetical protein
VSGNGTEGRADASAIRTGEPDRTASVIGGRTDGRPCEPKGPIATGSDC